MNGRTHKRGAKIPLLLFCTALVGTILPAQELNDQIVFVKVFSAITTAQASVPMPQRGQGNHMLMVHFPKAALAVSPIQVRIEAAYSCAAADPNCLLATWVPISADIVSAPLAGAVVYSMTVANGVFPAIRVNSTTVTPGASPMDVWYVGSPFPVSNFTFTGDRFIPNAVPPQFDKVTFVICNEADCAVASDVTNHWIAAASGTFRECFATAKIAPTGASLIMRINLNGVNIFSSNLTIPAGSTAVISTTAFSATNTVVQEDLLTIDITQIGSVVAGQTVTVMCIVDLS